MPNEAPKGTAPAPLILLFSPREEIRSLLTAGLLHGNYRLIEAETSYIAGVKANQYVPDLVIVDITESNIRDFLFLTRLERSVRTRDIAVLVALTTQVRTAIDTIRDEVSPGGPNPRERFEIVEYPFHFSQLVRKIDTMLAGAKARGLAEGAQGATVHGAGELLMNPHVSVEAKLRELETAMEKNWAFPFTVVRALDVMESETGCWAELARCIESDSAATTCILSIANRTQFAKRSGRVAEVIEAVKRIGFRETRDVLAAMSLIDITSGVHSKYGFSRADFWTHSLSTAIIAHEVCSDAGHRRPELAFVAGLIHDIGKIPVDNAFSHIFARLLEDTTNHIAPFHEAEYKFMGFTHAECGHFFTSAWHFPTQITLSILNHHRPSEILSWQVSGDRIVQESVYVANVFAKALTMGHSCDEVLGEIPQEMLRELKSTTRPDDGFVEMVEKRFHQYYEYLKLSQAEIPLANPRLYEKDFEVLIVYGTNTRFHPIEMALRNNGYRVHTSTDMPATPDPKVRIVVFIPDRGAPLDVTVGPANTLAAQPETPYLRVFLLDKLDAREPKREFASGDVVLMDRHRLDMRIVLHVMEDYFYATTMGGV